MKKFFLTYLFSMLLLTGSLLSSCSDDSGMTGGGNDISETADGEGSLSFGISLEEAVVTRSETAGTPAESRIGNFTIILYNTDGTIAYSNTYNTEFIADNNWNLTETGSTNKKPEEVTITGTSTVPVIHVTYKDIPKKSYKAAVIINPGTGGSGLTGVYSDALGNKSLFELFSNQAKSYQSLSHPFELTGGLKNNTIISKGLGYGLINNQMTYPAKYDDTFYQNTRFVMSNADGLTEITKDMFKPTVEEAQNAPVAVRVERAVAKVALYKSYTGTTLPSGGELGNVAWAADIINYYWLPVRQAALIAPLQGNSMELPSTDRRYRYATDANFSGVSALNSSNAPGTQGPAYHFYTITSETTPDDFLVRTWITTDDAADTHKYEWEYIAENTMAADEQYEDVMTRIVLRCTYAPPTTMNLNSTSITLGESYYSYKNKVISFKQMVSLLFTCRHEYPAELDGLFDLLLDKNFREYMIPEVEDELPPPLGSPGTRALLEDHSNCTERIYPPIVGPDNLAFEEPATSRKSDGLTFYKKGVNYYSIPIRHFTDTESPDGLMSYGRYGVVRNNFYKLKITDVQGLGEIEIPEPKEPEAKLSLSTEIANWDNTTLIIDL